MNIYLAGLALFGSLWWVSDYVPRDEAGMLLSPAGAEAYEAGGELAERIKRECRAHGGCAKANAEEAQAWLK